MPRRYSTREIVMALQNAGFSLIHQRGSHIKLSGVVERQTRVVIVPQRKEVHAGTFQSILRQSGLTRREFEENL